MNDLVFIEPKKMNETPFTTSEVIAEYAGVKHHALQQLIATHQRDFEEFGKVAFQMRALPESKTGQSAKVYRLNEEQATLLMTYLRNTPRVREFKKRLVRDFYLMRKELMSRYVEREARKPVRREMTDAIRDFLPDSPHKAMWYKHFTDLAYTRAFGMTAAALRKERGAPKDANATEYMTSDEIRCEKRVEGQIGVLLETGFGYQEIKTILFEKTHERIEGNTGPALEQRTTSYIDKNGEKKTGLISYGEAAAKIEGNTGPSLAQRETDWSDLIDAERAKGEGANQNLLQYYESERNKKIYDRNMNYQQTDNYGGTLYGEIARKAEESTDTNYLNGLMDMLNSRYESALSASDQQTAYAIEQARARVQAQIASLNSQYKDTNRQLYADYMKQQKVLPQQLAAMGVTGGLTESTLSGLGTSYAEALAGNERSRLTNIGDIQSGLTDAEYAARIAAAERAQSLGSQYMTNYAAYAQALQEQKNYESELAYQKEQQQKADALNRAELLAQFGNFSAYGDVYGAEYAAMLNAAANPVVQQQGVYTPKLPDDDEKPSIDGVSFDWVDKQINGLASNSGSAAVIKYLNSPGFTAAFDSMSAEQKQRINARLAASVGYVVG